jgi:hypothetical protein
MIFGLMTLGFTTLNILKNSLSALSIILFSRMTPNIMVICIMTSIPSITTGTIMMHSKR